MSSGKDDPRLEVPTGCESCDAPLEQGQRYCLRCGVRSGPIPAEFAGWLATPRPAAAMPAEEPKTPELPVDDATPAPGDEEFENASFAERYMPEPRSAAIATMALLAFGVVIGAATGPLAQSAAVSPIIVEMGPAAQPAPELEEAVEEAPEEAVVEEGGGGGGGEEPNGGGQYEGGNEGGKPSPPKDAGFSLPPIDHVFVIALGDHGFEEAFGSDSPAPYLAETLVAEGELLENYYAVTQGRLANELALLSGQGPTMATAEDCPAYAEIESPTIGTEEQVEGEGCVYPEATKTLAAELVEAKKSWKSYVEGGGGCAEEPPRNPFLLFHSVLDAPDCAEHNVDLAQLETDLASTVTTPSFSYVVPGPCHDGSEQSCEEGTQAGLAATQPFLEEVVPKIQESTAYKAGGLIAITFAQAPQEGPGADSSACCGTPEYPNLPPIAAPPLATGPVKTSGGGGRVGLLLLSPYVTAGTVNESTYNHFSLLLSIEELFKTPAIGYSASPLLTPFDSSVYNLAS